MKGLGLASWRFTFVVWSLVLVLWGLVTLSINRSSLLFIRGLIGEHGRVPVLLLTLVIALPMVFDAIRNVPGIRRRWRRQREHDRASCVWSESVPVSTPRVFRHPRGDDEGGLTWRERSIVEQGQLAWGSVEHHGELSSVRFDSSWGDSIASRPVRVNGHRPRANARAPLLFEPGANVGVAPTLLGLEFLAAEASDQRPLLRADASDVVHHEATARDGIHRDDRTCTTLRVPLLATLHPVERMSRYRSSEVGELALEGSRLSATQGGQTVSVRLDQPFRVMLSIFMVSPATAELHVRIEARANGAYRVGRSDGLTFKTELPQARVDRRLDATWVDASYVKPSDFDRVWAVLVDAAEDSMLTASVSRPA